MKGITNMFVIYKNGFLEAKRLIVKCYKLGKEIDIDEINKEINDEKWYNYGYEDGLRYFADLVDTRSLDLEGFNEFDVLQDLFNKRIEEMNEYPEDNQRKIAI